MDPLWRRWTGNPYYVLGARVLATVEKRAAPEEAGLSFGPESDEDAGTPRGRGAGGRGKPADKGRGSEAGEKAKAKRKGGRKKAKRRGRKKDPDQASPTKRDQASGGPASPTAAADRAAHLGRGPRRRPPDLRTFEPGRIVRLNPDGSFGVKLDEEPDEGEERPKALDALHCESLKPPRFRVGVRVEFRYSPKSSSWFLGAIVRENPIEQDRRGRDKPLTFKVVLDDGSGSVAERVPEDLMRLEGEGGDGGDDSGEEKTAGDDAKVDDAKIDDAGRRNAEARRGKAKFPSSVTSMNPKSSQGNVPRPGDTVKIMNCGRNYASLENEWALVLRPFDARPAEDVLLPSGKVVRRKPPPLKEKDPARTWCVQILTGEARRILAYRENLLKFEVGATKDMARMQELKTATWAAKMVDAGRCKDPKTTADQLRDRVRELKKRFPTAHDDQIRHAMEHAKGHAGEAAKYCRKDLGIRDMKGVKQHAKFKRFGKLLFCKHPRCNARRPADDGNGGDYCELHARPTPGCALRLKGLTSPEFSHLNGRWAVMSVPTSDEEERRMKMHAARGLYEIELNKVLVPQEVLSVVVRDVTTRHLPTRLKTAQRVRVSTATRAFMAKQRQKAEREAEFDLGFGYVDSRPTTGYSREGGFFLFAGESRPSTGRSRTGEGLDW
jgi:hypothetical protein